MKQRIKRFERKIITEELRALRWLRLEKNWSLEQASAKLGIKSKGLGHIENGRVNLSKERLEQILFAYGLHRHDLLRAKRMLKDERKNHVWKKTTRTVLQNCDRRSYRKEITKEVRVLRCLRHLKNIPQDQASALCGYSRPTIGHIENGRIEIPMSRIHHIVTSYGFEMNYFDQLMKEETLRDEAYEFCVNKLRDLPDEKVKLVQSIISNF